MKVKTLIFTILLCNLFLNSIAEEIVFSYNGKNVLKYEFINAFKKSNLFDIQEFLNNYISYKLKVEEAYNLKNDTLPESIDAFNALKHEMFIDSLIDKTQLSKLAIEEYSKMQKEVNISQIFFAFPKYYTFTDTLEVYNKALAVFSRIQKGENINNIALETSDDSSVEENKGYLGFLSSFQMLYNVENHVYSNQKDTLIGPIRSTKGYHIIRINDFRNSSGLYKIAHIMVSSQFRTIDEAKAIIDMVYTNVTKEEFESLAKQYSEDIDTKNNGGNLDWIKVGMLPQEFDNVVINLNEIGNVSEPFFENNSWHIVKLIDRKNLPNFNLYKNQVISKILNSDRKENLLEDPISKFANINNIQKYCGSISKMYYNDSIKNEIIILQIGEYSFTKNDFGRFISNNIHEELKAKDINGVYEFFIKDNLLNLMLNNYISKNPNLIAIYKEAKTNFLHNKIMNEVILSKIDNSEELKSYYEKNKLKYLEDKKVKGFLIYSKDFSKLSTIEKLINNSVDQEKIKKIYPESKIIFGVFKKFENQIIDVLCFKETNIIDNISNYKFVGNEIIPNVLPFDDVKDKVILDYFQFLNNIWIENLKKKYDLKINVDNIK